MRLLSCHKSKHSTPKVANNRSLRHHFTQCIWPNFWSQMLYLNPSLIMNPYVNTYIAIRIWGICVNIFIDIATYKQPKCPSISWSRKFRGRGNVAVLQLLVIISLFVAGTIFGWNQLQLYCSRQKVSHTIACVYCSIMIVMCWQY